MQQADPALLFQRAEACGREGRTAEAEVLCRQVLAAAPGHVGALYTLAALLRISGRHHAAVAGLQAALAVAPPAADLLFQLGLCLQEIDQVARAAEQFRAAIALRPTYREALQMLGDITSDRAGSAAAAAYFRDRIARTPEIAEAYYGLGGALMALSDLPGAAAAYRAALRLRPDYVQARVNLGAVLGNQGFLREAETELRQVLARAPDLPEALGNLGNVLRDGGRLAEAEACLRRALSLRPRQPWLVASLAAVHLTAGDYAAGWPGYESRFETVPARRISTTPRWQGEPLAGRTLLVYAEQGIGDVIQFCRFIAPAAAGGRVVFEVSLALHRLLSSLDAPVALWARGLAPLAVDVECPLMSLPLALGTTLATLPADVPYLAAPADRVAFWRHRLGRRTARQKLRVGLTWSGNPANAANGKRSLPRAQMEALVDVPGVRFVSLQKDAGLAGPGVTDWSAELDDLAETAALIEALDLVISVDTAVAHLAGALGKPVWLLNRFDTCWRWLLEREDSPWYPTLRQFRQEQPRSWDGVVARVRQALRELVATC